MKEFTDSSSNDTKIGFQFKKVSKPKIPIIGNSIINNDTEITHKEEIDFVTSIDNKTIKGTKANSSDNNNNNNVIPLITVNKYKYNKNKTDNVSSTEAHVVDNSDDDLLSKAKKELIEESKKIDNNDEKSLPAWKSLLINKLPNEFENDSKCDVSMRPEEPKLEDYEKIPVDIYGIAMLRGMGWKEGDAIGGINKAITPIIEPQLRPRGLGLGADISLKKQLEENAKPNTSKDILRKGCHVYIEFGPYKGSYGTVEDISGEDLIYASVKLTSFKENVMLSPDILRIVTKKEFDLESKVINKTKYEEYKNKEKHNFEKEKKYTSHQAIDNNTDKEDIWIVPKIRVQVMDKSYKNGKYYKDKIVILETRGTECTCRTKDRKILNISQAMLRTVIPSSSSSHVMVLRGKYKGKLATIENIDWKRDSVTINLTGFIAKPFSVSFDDVSEFYDRMISWS